MARNVAFVSKLMETWVEFIAVDMPTANRLTIHFIAAMAEHKAKMISARTKATLRTAKARGTLLGSANPKIREHAVVSAARTDQRASNLVALVDGIHRVGTMPARLLSDYARERGAGTPWNISNSVACSSILMEYSAQILGVLNVENLEHSEHCEMMMLC
jgi:hypothetical protein